VASAAPPISVLPTVNSVFLILAIAKKTWLNPGSSPALLKVFLLVAAGLLLILPLPYHRLQRKNFFLKKNNFPVCRGRSAPVWEFARLF
jgi:hypothetical protein